VADWQGHHHTRYLCIVLKRIFIVGNSKPSHVCLENMLQEIDYIPRQAFLWWKTPRNVASANSYTAVFRGKIATPMKRRTRHSSKRPIQPGRTRRGLAFHGSLRPATVHTSGSAGRVHRANSHNTVTLCFFPNFDTFNDLDSTPKTKRWLPWSIVYIRSDVPLFVEKAGSTESRGYNLYLSCSTFGSQTSGMIAKRGNGHLGLSYANVYLRLLLFAFPAKSTENILT